MLRNEASQLGILEQGPEENFGLSGSFSFYPTKQITTGEGGIIITNNKDFYNKVKKLKAFGIDTDVSERKVVGDYDVKSLGFNYRMTDFQAALGLSQFKRLKKFELTYDQFHKLSLISKKKKLYLCQPH